MSSLLPPDRAFEPVPERKASSYLKIPECITSLLTTLLRSGEIRIYLVFVCPLNSSSHETPDA